MFLYQDEPRDYISDSGVLPAKQKPASFKCSAKSNLDGTGIKSEITLSKNNNEPLPHVLSTNSSTHCSVTKSIPELPAQSIISPEKTDKQYGIDQDKFCGILQKICALLNLKITKVMITLHALSSYYSNMNLTQYS